MNLDGQFIFDILLVVASGTTALFISMMRETMKDMKDASEEVGTQLRNLEVTIPKEYARREDLKNAIEDQNDKLEIITADIKKLLQRA